MTMTRISPYLLGVLKRHHRSLRGGHSTRHHFVMRSAARRSMSGRGFPEPAFRPSATSQIQP